ncbi:hypothetical protein HID58_049384 [Brassica napus]|uniref:Uncharacterized protein n=2 Tax=Brassica TaxID=3705 RepID=A0A0D3AWX6_BRAOL|nr:hypothetical protein HID58_049384 [Brassica napus]CAF1920662.1 unnamed protein product [Brassica napus]
MEMKILEALNFYLVVFHPYRSLPEFLQDSGLNDTSIYDLFNLGSCQRHLQGWTSSFILIHPLYLITLACIYIASVYKEKDIRTWFEELSVDMNIVSFQNCTFDHKVLFK